MHYLTASHAGVPATVSHNGIWLHTAQLIAANDTMTLATLGIVPHATIAPDGEPDDAPLGYTVWEDDGNGGYLRYHAGTSGERAAERLRVWRLKAECSDEAGRLVLIEYGLYTEWEALIATLPKPQQVAFERRLRWKRSNEMMAAGIRALVPGRSDEQYDALLDEMFAQGIAIEKGVGG